MRQGTGGEPYELSDLIEKAKDKAGRAIIKATGERFPPFYNESYDHILRDEDERAQFLDALIDGALEGEAVETPEDWPTLYVSDAGGHEPGGLGFAPLERGHSPPRLGEGRAFRESRGQESSLPMVQAELSRGRPIRPSRATFPWRGRTRGARLPPEILPLQGKVPGGRMGRPRRGL